ncbi:hypothetical protein RJ53_06825 [Methanocalculus chunghsingensis]|uniref:Uncharacterized protein n=1 Tax=Methanocalculus chunghsingensis TaxID=156457 RepID=A0A8J8B724_9EURY|nr:hypothetical protein [Methanocalculus chunghsingensis]MBR1369222.1 hypothetical protein [Methanocalculus chunghsingensis]
MNTTTTIRISRRTKGVLDTLKKDPKESYDLLISRLATSNQKKEPASDERSIGSKMDREEPGKKQRKPPEMIPR